MKGKQFFIFIVIFLLVPQLLTGQDNNNGTTFLSRSRMQRFANPVLSKLSLLDPNKFSMSHSYTMSFVSSGGKGNMVGLYMNTMKYQFSSPLSLTVHVGYAHQPFAKADSNNMLSNNTILSGFELTYRPKKNFFLKIEYGSLPVKCDPFYRYGSWYDW